ncbi:MAG: primosomal protein N' [Myxococcales bacterium]|nr:MAG: primosomal protein N' [Myxococcales bacterium]
MTPSSENQDSYVEVAIPVPLRQSFTYKVRRGGSTDFLPGMRVAVPFGRRKLAGFVLGEQLGEIKAGVRYKHIADLLDKDPVFSEELLTFLKAAADYYMHPVGEVLRAAAPALPSEALSRLRGSGFLKEGEKLPGAQMSQRTTWRVCLAKDKKEAPRLGPKQLRALHLVEERSEILWEELRTLAGLTRSSLRAMVDKGVLQISECEVLHDPFAGNSAEKDVTVQLNDAQLHAVERLKQAVIDHEAKAFLLHGVTGSGKTEVYMHAIDRVLEAGRGAIVLVPEIALTPQLVSRFRARFGEGIAVLHSGLGARERYDAWQRLSKGELKLAIGARSALFAPVRDLGMIVVDEEHDASFKQEDGFRYSARDMALLRAHLVGGVCVLGSATPSLESYHLCKQGRCELLELPARATEHKLPEVHIVDLTKQGAGLSGHPLLTPVLHQALQACLNDKGQAILFLNRRGFSSLRCASCSEIAQCPACSVALTAHRNAQRARCHYCDFATHVDAPCPNCKSPGLEAVGVGTERVEELLRDNFPEARIARLDRDTASKAGGVEKVLDRMKRHELDILVGTQMVTKGHDLPEVTLVGVVLADQSLLFPDFRASERTFQLLAQVAGRAGRGARPGKVIVQSFQPDHPAVQLACRHDYHGFFTSEIRVRQQSLYPPFSRLAAIRIDATDEQHARSAADRLAQVARSRSSDKVQVLGPAPAPIARLRARYRFRVLLRASGRKSLRVVLDAVAQHIGQGLGSARASIDIDPVSML